TAKADDVHTPIDFRLHVRLADGFRRLKDWGMARDQLQLARKLSPRDMLVLRELGRAELEISKYNNGAAIAYFEEMKSYGPQILIADEEALMLYVRIMVTSGDWPKAADVLASATELAGRSSYVANMRAIATLKARGKDQARAYFSDLLRRELDGKRDDRWTVGNLVNAALGVGDVARADEFLAKLKVDPEAMLDRDSIARYFDEIVHETGLKYDWRAHWS